MITEHDIEAFGELPTPFYHYDLAHLTGHAGRAMGAAQRYGYHVHYALKANSRPEVLQVLKEVGFGADCVSGAEVVAALEAGFRAGDIAFAGVGKTDRELDLAMREGIFSINVESLEELQVVDGRARALGKKASIALRLNPDVNAHTHHYITTGLEENKFGISAWQLPEVMECLRASEGLELTGLHFHIGSQVTGFEPFRNLCNRINDFQQLFAEHGFVIRHINAGGGLGVDYDDPDNPSNPDFESFFALFDRYLGLRPGQELHFELGRALVANSADLISRVLYVKKGQKTDFLILDAGMTELIRPALYQSYHRIENLSRRGGVDNARYDVVGPVCESSDCFGKAVVMPGGFRGDLIAIRTAGAYGESMASHYNLRQLESPHFRLP